ncbi:MAG: hypothetical protein H6869_09180 [Rhodospirillales bacterium]|nr:hypothetical protein [Rhodospirillales bacterium]
MKQNSAPKTWPELSSACDQISARLQEAADKLGIPLRGGGFVDQSALKNEIAGLKAVYNELKFSPAYERWSENRRKALIKTLFSSPEFVHAAANWEQITPKMRQDTIRQMSLKLQEAYSNKGTLFTPKSVRFRFFEQEAPKEKGAYFERGRAINGLGGWHFTVSLNTHKDAGALDFGRAMNAAFHENLHGVHFALMDYPDRCKELDHHPLKDDMAMLNQAKQIQVEKFSRILALYHSIPWEADAHRQSKLFEREITEALHAHKKTQDVIPPAPH